MQPSNDRRRDLRAAYRARTGQPVVYLLRHRPSGRILVDSTTDLASLRNRLAFGQATSSPGVLDRRLLADARRDGVAAFDLEVLDTLGVDPGTTPDQLTRDLAALVELWREKLADAPQY